VTVETSAAQADVRHSSLEGCQVGRADQLELAELPHLSMVNLRVDPEGPDAERIATTNTELIGPYARDVLEHGCPVGLHPRAFGTGRCVQTMLAKTQVVIWRPDSDGAGGPDEVFRVLVRGSFAGYLAAWLTDAAGEYWAVAPR
jgi:heterotetrameric sarcosine oxidase gamma subunit